MEKDGNMVEEEMKTRGTAGVPMVIELELRGALDAMVYLSIYAYKCGMAI